MTSLNITNDIKKILGENIIFRIKQKSPQIHFYTKNETIRSMSFVTFI